MSDTDIRTTLKRMGATESQLNSKTMEMVEEAIANDAVDGMATADERVKSLMTRIGRAEDSLDENINLATIRNAALNDSVSKANAACREVDRRLAQLGAAADLVTIKEQSVMDAVNAYTLMLTRSKEILGPEGMTEEVTKQIVETAGHIMRIAAKAPKEQPKPSTPKYYR